MIVKSVKSVRSRKIWAVNRLSRAHEWSSLPFSRSKQAGSKPRKSQRAISYARQPGTSCAALSSYFTYTPRRVKPVKCPGRRTTGEREILAGKCHDKLQRPGMSWRAWKQRCPRRKRDVKRVICDAVPSIFQLNKFPLLRFCCFLYLSSILNTLIAVGAPVTCFWTCNVFLKCLR